MWSIFQHPCACSLDRWCQKSEWHSLVPMPTGSFWTKPLWGKVESVPLPYWRDAKVSANFNLEMYLFNALCHPIYVLQWNNLAYLLCLAWLSFVVIYVLIKMRGWPTHLEVTLENRECWALGSVLYCCGCKTSGPVRPTHSVGHLSFLCYLVFDHTICLWELSFQLRSSVLCREHAFLPRVNSLTCVTCSGPEFPVLYMWFKKRSLSLYYFIY